MKIAVIGSGIAGLSTAYALERDKRAKVTLFEAGDYLGGHTNTVDIEVDGVAHPVDTGFLVFNHRTYPELTRLFAELEVPTAKSEMSFAVSLGGSIEWAGTSLATVFAQPANLLRPRFLAMLRDILRFNREATAAAMAGHADVALGEYLRRQGYSDAFRDWYLLPMAAAIWSCPARAMLGYPFSTFARFCHNHGLLTLADRPQWHTVAGGAREYVRRMARHIGDIRLSTPVRGIRRTPAGVLVEHAARAGAAASIERFDQVVLACHSDQALALIQGPTRAEREVLGAITYQPNIAWLHTDIALLPRRRRVWAAWNYMSQAPQVAPGFHERPVAVSYLINKLQPVPFTSPVVVTLNPPTPPREDRVLARFDYAHPVFDIGAVRAQSRLEEIQGADRLWFAGAWTGYGFHEDGLKSGLAVAAALADRAAALDRAAA